MISKILFLSFIILNLAIAAKDNNATNKLDENKISITVDSKEGKITVDGADVGKGVDKNLIKTFLKKISKTDNEQNQKVSIGSDVSIMAGEEAEDLVVIGGNASVAGHVKGDIVVIAGGIDLKDGAQVDGDIVNIGGNFSKTDNAVTGGDVVKLLSGGVFKYGFSFLASLIGLGITAILMVLYKGLFFLTVLIIGLLALYIANEKTHQTIGDYFLKKPIKSFLFGLLVMAAVVVINSVLIVTIIGILIVPIVLTIIFLLGCWGSAILLTMLGEKLLHKSGAGKYAEFIVGLLILFLLTFIPFAGALIFTILNIVALGAVVATKMGNKGIPDHKCCCEKTKCPE